MAGIKEIAKLAGVSIGTVDRVLHDRGRCADDTRQRVLDAMRALDYRPNLTARRLKQNAPCRIAVLTPAISQDQGYWRTACEGVEKACREFEPFNVEIITCQFDRYRAAAFKKSCKVTDYQGVLFAPVLQKEALTLTAANPSTPFVAFDSPLAGAGLLQSLYQDGIVGGGAAADIMCMDQQPTASLAVIAYESENPNIKRRVTGFVDTVLSAGYKRPDCYYIPEEIASGDLAHYLQRQSIDLSVYGGLFIAKTGAYKYARLLNSNGHKTFIVGYDLVPENIDCLREGKLDALVSQNPARQVYEGIKTLVNRVLYNHLPQHELIWMPADILTVSNIDTYLVFHEYTTDCAAH